MRSLPHSAQTMSGREPAWVSDPSGTVRGGDAERAQILYDLGMALGWVGEAQPAFDAFHEAAEVASDASDKSIAKSEVKP